MCEGSIDRKRFREARRDGKGGRSGSLQVTVSSERLTIPCFLIAKQLLQYESSLNVAPAHSEIGAPRTRSGRISRGDAGGKSRGKASGNYSRGIPGVRRGQQQMIIGSDRRSLCNCRDLRENVLETQQTGKLRTTVGPEPSQIQAESGFFFFFFFFLL